MTARSRMWKLTLAGLLAILPRGVAAQPEPSPPEDTKAAAAAAAVERILDTRVVEVTLGRQGEAVVERRGVASEPGTWRLDGLPGIAFGDQLEVLPATPEVELGPLTLFREERPEPIPVETLEGLLRANQGRLLRLVTAQGVREGRVTAVLPGGVGSGSGPQAVLSGNAGDAGEGATAIPIAEIQAVEAVTGTLHLRERETRRQPTARLAVVTPGEVRLLYRVAGAHWSPRYQLEVVEAPAAPALPPAPLPVPIVPTADAAQPVPPPPPPPPPSPPPPRYGTARLTLEAEVTNGIEDWSTVRLRLEPGGRTVPDVTLTRDAIARLPLARAVVPFRQRLLWRAAPALDAAGHWRFAEGQGGLPPEAVTPVVEIRNAGRTPWPAGPLALVDAEGGVLRTTLPETPARGTAHIPLGPDPAVSVHQREEAIDHESDAFTNSAGAWDRRTLMADLVLQNRAENAVEVLVEKALVGEFLDAEPFPETVDSRPDPQAPDPNPRHLLEWTVVVPAGGEVVLHYRYRVYARP